MLQTNQFASFDQMFAPNAAKFRIMQNQVREPRALRHQIDLRQTANLVVKALYADQLGKHHAAIVETKRLAEIASQQRLLYHAHYPCHVASHCSPSAAP